MTLNHIPVFSLFALEHDETVTLFKQPGFVVFPDQKYGAGIYFCKNPRNLVTDTTEKCEMDHLICVFEAEVVTGLYTRGNQSDVVPSLINANNMKLYNSVVNDIHNPDIFVIFNRHQALPLYLLTCSMICNMGPKSQ